ncbi:TlpA family protein disulfide reductase [Echinicola soli]|uniref:TlpA family protein disulfide reductase n=1 Tax=Echinicola soli TaxID=2591634 RepID=A0A514CN09_9BACT|nr:TlpA disulfide reductase family protein [Echinicola soli]QDH81180.1 TlpA family protein disulfide reductase [Echinicola soli]
MIRKPISGFFLALCFIANMSMGQQQLSMDSMSLSGEMELIFDLSNMKDAQGGIIKVSGDYIHEKYEIHNDELSMTLQIEEPRKIMFSFLSAQTLKEDPNIAIPYSDYMAMLAVPGKYYITVDSVLNNSRVINESPYQKKFNELQEIKNSIGKNLQEEVLDEMKPSLEHAGIEFPFHDDLDKQVKDSVIKIYSEKLRKRYPRFTAMYQEQVFNFVKQHPDEPASLIELVNNSRTVGRVGSNSGQFEMEQFIDLYTNLSERLKALPSARSAYAQVFGVSLVGKQAPAFTQNGPMDQPVSLTEFKGKVTLLEFWASWCGACRSTNPGLVKTYEQYHDKGFEILAVSLDVDKEKWLKAVEKDGLEWIHVSELNRFENSAVKLYHVSGIPSNFLIDKSGKIVQYNLKEEELNKYLKQLLE